MSDLSQLEQILGITFQDKVLLKRALTHRSYINENPKIGLNHNERLEFLGDAVLEMAVTEKLFRDYPDKNEGDLTSWRAALVNAKMLSDVSKKFDLNSFLFLSKGEARDTGKARYYILANAMEALIGAIYLDQGYNIAKEFIEGNILSELSRVLEKNLQRDPKSYFQEKAQEQIGITPLYKVLTEWGPDHSKKFKIGVFLGAEQYGEGEGRSKQEAEESAAADALEKQKWV